MAEKGENFRYIVRIANTDLDGNKPIPYALAKIKGIGVMTGYAIARKLGLDPTQRIGYLSEEETEKIEKLIEEFKDNFSPWLFNRRKDYKTGEDLHLVGSDLEFAIKEDINRLRRIRAYRGIRHEMGLPVRGQRNKAHHRRFRRKYGAVGVTKGKR